MDDKKLNDVLAPPAREPDPAVLVEEAALWERLEADLANEALHRQYVGFVLRHNLLKDASRRYGRVVDDKERFTIDQRRVARRYHQNLVNVLFMTPGNVEPPRKRGSLEPIAMFLATTLMLAGLTTFLTDTSRMPAIVTLTLEFMFPAGLAFIGILVWTKVRRFRRGQDAKAPRA